MYVSPMLSENLNRGFRWLIKVSSILKQTSTTGVHCTNGQRNCITNELNGMDVIFSSDWAVSLRAWASLDILRKEIPE